MFRALRFLFLLGILAAAAVWLSDRPGAVTVHWLGWRVDSSVALLITLFAIVAVTAALLYRVWLFLRRAPGRMVRAYGDGRQRRGYLALTRGMVAVAAGDEAEADRQAKRADNLLSDPPLTMLLSAQAAQLNGDESAAKKFFTAMLEKPETEFLGLRGLLTQALKGDDRAEALKLAERAYRLRPTSGWVASSLIDLQIKSGQWAGAGKTLGRSVRNKLVNKDEARRREAVLALLESRQMGEDGRIDEAISLLKKAHKLAPGFVPAAVELAGRLADAGRSRPATRVVEKTWGLGPHPDFVPVYCRARGAEDPMQRLKSVQRLAGFRPDHRESRFAVAEAALEAKLWGEARKNLEFLVNDNPDDALSRRLCRLMARLEERERGNEKLSREWLVQATNADPDPAWICRSCGNVSQQWDAACGNCGAFDESDWGTPPHISAINATTAPPVLSGTVQADTSDGDA